MNLNEFGFVVDISRKALDCKHLSTEHTIFTVYMDGNLDWEVFKKTAEENINNIQISINLLNIFKEGTIATIKDLKSNTILGIVKITLDINLENISEIILYNSLEKLRERLAGGK